MVVSLIWFAEVLRKYLWDFYDGKRLNQDAKTADQQEYLEKTILKLNYKSFTQIVLLGANHYIPFMQLKSTDRRTIIEDLLWYSDFLCNE